MGRPWMPLNIADYLADTGHLSTVEHGAYLLLIMHYWQKRCLPHADAMLARICRMQEDEWLSIRDTLAEFFDASWRHKRIEEELAKADDMLSKRKAAGKAGASARYGKRMDEPKQTNGLSPTPTQDTSSLRSDVGRARRASPKPDLDEFKSEMADLDAERLDALVKHRRKKGAQITGHSARLFRRDAAAAGLALPDAVDTCISRNWITVKADWLERDRRPSGQGPPRPITAASRAADRLRELANEPDCATTIELRAARSGEH